LQDNPRPADIDEVTHGLAVEGWRCPPYGGHVEGTKGADNPGRMMELCQPTPSERKPYPVPKPRVY